MKQSSKISILVSLIIITGLCIPCARTETAKQKMQPFKIMVLRSYDKNRDVFYLDKEMPLAEYGENGFTFYKITEITKDGKTFAIPAKDAKGNPVKLDPSAKNFPEEVKKCFENTFRCRFLGPSYDRGLYLGMVISNKDNGFYYIKRLYRNRDSESSLINFGVRLFYCKEKLPPGSCFFADGNFNVDIRKYDGKKLSLYKMEAVNPDVKNECVPALDSFYIPSWGGYIWMKIGERETFVNGEKKTLPAKVETRNGTTMVPGKWVLENFTSSNTTSYDEKTKLWTFRRFIEKEWLEVKFTLGKKEFQIDGKKQQWVVPPYETVKGVPMVPLRQFCEIFQRELYWRSFDKTMLVKR
ncbi:MAG: copper amine oxidase N-terminal domain-containing protein [Caldisericales bacterium]|nr:copper amine oxidase N-terminal domain-containing protein [Caldisericales bacterium]